jgi:hypothetical protein
MSTMNAAMNPAMMQQMMQMMMQQQQQQQQQQGGGPAGFAQAGGWAAARPQGGGGQAASDWTLEKIIAQVKPKKEITEPFRPLATIDIEQDDGTVVTELDVPLPRDLQPEYINWTAPKLDKMYDRDTEPAESATTMRRNGKRSRSSMPKARKKPKNKSPEEIRQAQKAWAANPANYTMWASYGPKGKATPLVFRLHGKVPWNPRCKLKKHEPQDGWKNVPLEADRLGSIPVSVNDPDDIRVLNIISEKYWETAVENYFAFTGEKALPHVPGATAEIMYQMLLQKVKTKHSICRRSEQGYHSVPLKYVPYNPAWDKLDEEVRQRKVFTSITNVTHQENGEDGTPRFMTQPGSIVTVPKFSIIRCDCIVQKNWRMPDSHGIGAVMQTGLVFPAEERGASNYMKQVTHRTGAVQALMGKGASVGRNEVPLEVPLVTAEPTAHEPLSDKVFQEHDADTADYLAS